MDYARALVEHPKWRWEPGMVVLDNESASETFVVYRVGPLRWPAPWPRVGPGFRRSPAMGYCSATDEYTFDMPTHRELGTLPDINHPATKGWLLHMLREAVEGHAFCDLESTEPDEWRVNADYLEMDGPWDFPTAPTEGEALAAALLAVWGQAA